MQIKASAGFPSTAGFKRAVPIISITAPEPSTRITSLGETGDSKTVDSKNLAKHSFE